MKSTQLKFATLSLLASASIAAQAHPGHDHSALSSGAIHSLTALAIIGVSVVTAVVLRKHLQRKHKQQ